MAITRTYGNEAVAGLAKKAGEVQANEKVAEMQHQASMQQMQQQFQKAQLDVQLKTDLQKTIANQQYEQNKAAQAQVRQDAIESMAKDWEVEKMQLRSQADFQATEREYAMKRDYDMYRRQQEQVEVDNKLKAIDNEVAQGRLDDVNKGPDGMTEAGRLRMMVNLNLTRMPQPTQKSMSEADMLMQGALQMFGEQGMNQSDAQESPNVEGTQSPVNHTVPKAQAKAVTGAWWSGGKVIHPEVIDPVLDLYVKDPGVKEADKVAIRILLQSNNTDDNLKRKLKAYKRILDGKEITPSKPRMSI